MVYSVQLGPQYFACECVHVFEVRWHIAAQKKKEPPAQNFLGVAIFSNFWNSRRVPVADCGSWCGRIVDSRHPHRLPYEGADLLRETRRHLHGRKGAWNGGTRRPREMSPICGNGRSSSLHVSRSGLVAIKANITTQQCISPCRVPKGLPRFTWAIDFVILNRTGFSWEFWKNCQGFFPKEEPIPGFCGAMATVSEP